ncbi:MAG: Gfo/Idh/MocA family protein [Terriglobales bacterium]
MVSRREFLGTVAAGAASLALGTTAESYARILGANDRVNFAVIGLHGRGYAHLSSIKANERAAHISYICDVDSRVLDKFAGEAQKELGYLPVREKDFRKILEAKDVDVVTIAVPDHWHTPMAILAMQADKHVYVEKPCSHDPNECDMIVRAQRKYGKLVQMGNQQRSSPHTIEIIQKIHDGLIGRAYFAKCWYSNNRGSIGIGKAVPVPDYLDWDLWQGPAPRRPYKDNIHPYNWHWFWLYGTGEALNNGTHEVDVCRWALNAGFPERVTSSGGRYAFHDDWEFYDTLVASFEYADKMITWEGMSCNGKKKYNRDRGSTIHGTAGTVLIDRNGYQVFSLDDKLVKEFKVGTQTSSHDLIGRDSMTDAHFRNMINAVRTGEKLHAPVSDAYVGVAMLQFSNIAWKLKRELKLDAGGHIAGDPEAAKLCGREYEKGWEIRV